MPQIGPAEILVVVLIGMLVFGPQRLPEIGRQVGNAMRHVKGLQDSVMNEINGVMHENEDAGTGVLIASTRSPMHHEDEVPTGSRPPSRFRATRPASSARSVAPSSRPPSRFRSPRSTSNVRT